LQKPDLAERLSSWAVELSEFNIRYEPHGPIKAQSLLDFINDLQDTPIEDQWTLHVDGSSNPKGVGAGIVLEGSNDILIEKSLHFAFKTLNNQAEYEAILVGLSLAREVGVKTLTCKTDSKLTAGHLNDEFQIKDPHPSTILPPSPHSHTIRLRTSSYRTYPKNRQHQSRHPLKISQHQIEKPPPISTTANTIYTLHHKYLPKPNLHPN